MQFKSEKQHQIDVQKLQKELIKKHSAFTISKKSPSNTLRNGEYKKNSHGLDYSHLNRLIHIDLTQMWVKVEPSITVKALCNALLQWEVIPQVVPEFSTITVGGAIMGAALESSSHRYGQFNDTCLEYELLLGDGSLILANAEKNSDLFYGVSGSYGTLALLTMAKIFLIKAKRYVRLTYHYFSKREDIFPFFRSSQESDFLEGILISNEQTVGIEGHLTDHDEGLPHFKQKQSWNPWFYQHLIELKNKKSHAEVMPLHLEVMPLRDYLFRLDRGAFWMGCYLSRFTLIMQILLKWNLKEIGSKIREQSHLLKSKDSPSFLFRLLFGWAFSSKKLYKIWHSVPKTISENIFFIQDFYAPFDKAPHILNDFIAKTELFPIWLCPIQGTKTPQFLSPHYGEDLLVNLGFYGIPKTQNPIPLLTQELEKAIVSFGGKKMLYSMTYYPEDFFSKIYEYERYKALRKKFYAEGVFLPLYKKVSNLL